MPAPLIAIPALAAGAAQAVPWALGTSALAAGAGLAQQYGSRQGGVPQSRNRRNRPGGMTMPSPGRLATPDNLNEGMTGANWPAGVPKPGTKPDPRSWPTGAAPGLGAPTAYGDSAARAREAEQRRMMQQYASKEYWDTEQGKAMLGLGQQMTAPKDAKLADYYGAQRAVGIGSIDEILSGLASVDDRYKEGGDLREWAQANQALALREYNKRFPGGTAGVGESELSAPTIDTANPTAGERALMDAKYALHGDPSAAPTPGAIPTPGGYTSDDRVIGLNDQGQFTVGEGAYGFDPALDQAPMAIAARPVPAEVNRAEAGSVVPVEAQKANELVERYKGITRGQLMSGY